jgi:hypothetical protein
VDDVDDVDKVDEVDEAEPARGDGVSFLNSSISKNIM